MLRNLITSLTFLIFSLCNRKQRRNNMTFNWKKERFNNLTLLFNNQSLFMSKDSSNNILSLKFSPDKVSRTIDLNSAIRVNLSDKREFTFCDREIKMTIINIFFQSKTLWQMPKRFPEIVSEYSRESCAMFLLSKSSMWFFIMVILHKSLTGSFKRDEVRTIMSSNDSLLPEFIETLNRGISTWFSLWDKYQMDAQKQMKAYDMRDTMRIASSTCGSHLIIHLGYLWKPNKSPCFNKMLTKRDSLFIGKLACESRMSCNIHCMKGIKSCNPFWASEMSGSNKVCLMQVSHLLCLNVRIRLIIAVSFWLNLASLSVTRENIGNSGDRWNVTNLSLFKLPLDNLCPNSREGRTAGLMRFQFFPDRENLFNRILRGLSPDSFWDTTSVFETFKSMFFKSFEPFREPNSTPLNQLEYLIETKSIFVKLYCFTAFLIFFLIIHRLFLLLNVFRRRLGDFK